MDVSEAESRRVYDPDGDGDDPRKTLTRGRRATVFVFDKGVYDSCKIGNAVWLADDETPGNGPDLKTDKNAETDDFGGISAEKSAKKETGNSGDFGETRSSVLLEREREIINAEKLESGESPSSTPPDDHTHTSLCECGDFRENSRETAKRRPFSDSSPESRPFFRGDFRGIAPNTADSALIPDSQSEPELTRLKIDPADFVKLPDGPMIETCPGCGGRMVHYKERYQVVKARGKGSPTLRICRGCYQRARDREAEAIQPLNTIPIADLERVEDPARFGRCTTCQIGPVAYARPDSDTQICQQCYEKLARGQVDIR
jgi:hypothetical protein